MPPKKPAPKKKPARKRAGAAGTPLAILVDPGTPTKEATAYWLTAEVYMSPYPPATDRCGKWLLFVRPDQVDAWWTRVVDALHAGQLGTLAKVSTARPNPNAASPNIHVLCVYTYDCDDRAVNTGIELRTFTGQNCTRWAGVGASRQVAGASFARA